MNIENNATTPNNPSDASNDQKVDVSEPVADVSAPPAAPAEAQDKKEAV